MNGKGKYLIALVGLFFLVLTFWYFSAILAYIGIAVVLSFIGRPVVEFLDRVTIKKRRIPAGVSAALTLALLWFVTIIFFRTFIPMVVQEAKQLSGIDVQSAVRSLDEPIKNIEAFVAKYSTEGSEFKIKAVITENLSSILKFSDVSSIFGSLVGTLGDLFIALFSISFITFFFLKDSSLFVDSLVLFVPERSEAGVRHVLDSIKNLLMRYFVGLFFEVILVGTLVTLGLTVVGMGFSHAVVIGLFAGMVNVIPYIGPIIGAMFGLVIGVATNLDADFYAHVVPLLGYTALVFMTVQLIDNILFQPLIYSNSVNAHPLEIFLVILLAGSMSGMLGMMLAIPAYTIFRVIAKEFFNQYRFVKKLTEKI